MSGRPFSINAASTEPAVEAEHLGPVSELPLRDAPSYVDAAANDASTGARQKRSPRLGFRRFLFRGVGKEDVPPVSSAAPISTRDSDLKALGIIASEIAHDYNNLLMGVLGNASLLLEELPDDSPGRRRVESIRIAARRASELSNQLLTCAGLGKFQLRPTELSSLVQEAVELLQPTFPRELSISISGDRDSTWVMADPTQLRQLVMNLIKNAVDACSLTLRPSISITTGERFFSDDALVAFRESAHVSAGRHLFLEVKDNGIGIPDDIAPRIFEPFFTTKATGSGLGLAGALSIVRGHQAAMSVESASGRGTTFCIVFTRAEATAGRGLRDLFSTAGVSCPDVIAGKTALVADDDPATLDITSQMLECLGMKVVRAADGDELRDQFAAHGPSLALVLADLTMPGAPLRDTIASIRDAQSNLPVIVTSGYAQSEVSRRLGPQTVLSGFLQKPFDPHSLREIVVAAITSA